MKVLATCMIAGGVAGFIVASPNHPVQPTHIGPQIQPVEQPRPAKDAVPQPLQQSPLQQPQTPPSMTPIPGTAGWGERLV